jgi:hypothetical protein
MPELYALAMKAVNLHLADRAAGLLQNDQKETACPVVPDRPEV